MRIIIEKFDPKEATQEDWEKYHVYRKRRQEIVNPEDPVVDNEPVEQMMKIESKEAKPHRFVVYEEGVKDKIIAQLVCTELLPTSASYKGNEHIFPISMAVLPEYQRKKIGTALISKAVELAKEKGKTKMMLDSSEASGKEFLQVLGADIALEGAENRLALEEVDWEMIDQWIKEGEERSPTAELKIFKEIPEELEEHLFEVYTETLNQQPLGDLEIGSLVITPEVYKEQKQQLASIGGEMIISIVLEEDNKISGVSDIVCIPARETIISQNLTGVQSDYRGHGKGKWLKAKMLRYIKENYPKTEFISTGNANENAPMLSINHRMGFKLHKENILGQIEVQKVEEYLAS
ncbi:MAG: GNAT family N-acetyltransferase [Candidatus Heimdallarchaeota archaeon]|nr:GNAT family N-acetyltransferase [Candidatus Heimdallarchaeota archaeon]MCK5049583.1 GNAT family N-acetyltransferase [Candidatus Heimdallarchaeota archaeon]